MKKLITGLIFSLFIQGCSLSVSYMPKSSKLYTPKSSSFPIPVFQMNEDLPNNYKVIGSISVQNNMGMTAKCGYKDVIIAAQNQARDVGGDAIQVVQTIPDFTGICFSLIVNVLTLESNN